MQILMLLPYAPLPPPMDLAGTKRNLPFLLELAKYNDICILSYGTPEEEKLFRMAYGKLFREICFVNNRRFRIINAMEKLWLLGTGRSSFRQIYRRAMQLAIDKMTAITKFDVIHCCVPFFGYFRFPLGIPLCSDTHEVKYDLLHRTSRTISNPFWKILTYLSYKFGMREELELCNNFDCLITTTQRDLSLFKKDLPNQFIKAIPNGVADIFYENLDIKPEPFTMVFTGLFTHLPNSSGIIFFLDKIFPLILRNIPAARVFIVGKSPPRELSSRSSKNIIVTGFVEDVRPYIAKSQVFIIPLLAGGGIRGKALEAMAMKRPIVTTTIGVEGIKLRNGHSALFADTPQLFADSVTNLFMDPHLRHNIAHNAYKLAICEHDWEANGKELDKTLRFIARTKRPTNIHNN